MKLIFLTFVIFMILLGFNTTIFAQDIDKEANTDSLVVLWTSGDPYVAERVCLMYTHAAKQNNWFSEVVLIVWGPSSKLLAENEKLQEKVKSMREDGVILKACIVCASMYGVTEELRKLGAEVKGMGKPLTDYLKKEWRILTF